MLLGYGALAMLRFLMFKTMATLMMAGFAIMVDFQQSQKTDPNLTLESYIQVRWAFARLLLEAQLAEAELHQNPTSAAKQAGRDPDLSTAARKSTQMPDDAGKDGPSLLQKPQFGGFGTCRVEGGRKTCSISDG